MLEELIIFVKQGVVCDLTREREARFGEWSIFTHDVVTFWWFGGGESDLSFQGVNVLVSKWRIWTGRSLKPNEKLSFFLSFNLFIYSKTINWGHATCYACGMGIWQWVKWMNIPALWSFHSRWRKTNTHICIFQRVGSAVEREIWKERKGNFEGGVTFKWCGPESYLDMHISNRTGLDLPKKSHVTILEFIISMKKIF